MRRSTMLSLVVIASFMFAVCIAEVVEGRAADAQDSGDENPVSGSIYKEEPPDLYPDEKGIPEAGEDFPAFNQVIDNSDESRVVAPGWKKGPDKPEAYGKDYLVPGRGAKSRAARYKVDIPATDVYSVFAWWPFRAGQDAGARVGIDTTSGRKWTEIEQGMDGGYWVPIGEYEMKKGQRYGIRLRAASGMKDGPVADAVAVVRGIEDFPPDPPGMEPVGDDTSVQKEQTMSGMSETTYSGASVRRISRRIIIRRAKKHIGTPYKLGGLSACKAFRTEDCSCFTRLVFKRWRTLADNPAAQRQASKMKKINRKRLRRGDLVFHDTTGDGRMTAYDHVSIYAGNGYVIHANSYYRYKKVHRQKMKWLKNYKGARRVRY